MGAPVFAEATADKPEGEQEQQQPERLARRSLGEGGSDGVGESEGRSPSEEVEHGQVRGLEEEACS